MTSYARTRTPSRAWGWVAHLEQGGTTPWRDWAVEGEPTRAVMPGAQQLELLRRLNAAGLVDPGLAGRVLTATASGRGRPDLPLLGVPLPTWGPRAVDPATLDADELLRVASTLLAEDLVALGPDRPEVGLPRPWRRRYRMVGDPLAVTVARTELTAAGHQPGGRHPRVLVLLDRVDLLMAHSWTYRCFGHKVGPWTEWLDHWRGREALPPRLDVPRAVAEYTDRPADVRVLTRLDRLPRTGARQVGVRRLAPLDVPGAHAADLARRVNHVLKVLVHPHEAEELMATTLWRRIPAGTAGLPTVPAEHRRWLGAAADRLAEDVRGSGYPVLGDLADLAPRFTGSTTPEVADEPTAVLDLAVRMLVDGRWQHEPRRL
ncbi:MAG: hypothetical protein ACI379_15635 [Nocardioides sp.]|uniref:hypothetical protein n=1 Tax=Nocardioides sp. TaxID=35761 RepID=UPI003F05C83B